MTNLKAYRRFFVFMASTLIFGLALSFAYEKIMEIRAGRAASDSSLMIGYSNHSDGDNPPHMGWGQRGGP